MNIHSATAHVLGSHFIATCGCGWNGPLRWSLWRARRDARRHEGSAS